MSLKKALAYRGLKPHQVYAAVTNTEKVMATVISNASKNTTGAQAMKGNLSTLAADLKVLYELKDEFVKADAEAAKQSKTPAAKKPVEDKPTEKEADVSKAEG